MSFIIVKMVDCIVPRGGYKTIRLQVEDDLGENYDLTDHTAKLYLSRELGVEDPLLEKEGSIFSVENGTVEFDFEPEDTEQLMLRSYDMEVIVTDSNSKEFWPALIGNLAVEGSTGGAESE